MNWLNSNETIYMEGSGVYLKSKLKALQGTFYITNNRIAFGKRKGIVNLLLGPLFMHLKKGNHIVFSIHFNQLKSIKEVKQGFGKKFVFSTTNGNYELQFNKNRDKWLTTIEEAIKKNNPKINIDKVGDYYTFNH